MGLEEWDAAVNLDYEKSQRTPPSDKSLVKPDKKSGKNVSVDEAIKANPLLDDLLRKGPSSRAVPGFEGEARQKGLSKERFELPYNPYINQGPGSGVDQAAKAMRAK